MSLSHLKEKKSTRDAFLSKQLIEYWLILLFVLFCFLFVYYNFPRQPLASFPFFFLL